MTQEERLELAELLDYRTRSAFDIRRDRLIAAEMRLGMWDGERFTGVGLAELISRARTGKPLTHTQFTVANFGMSPGEHRKRTRIVNSERR
jgi:hypothetical protein